ncbi:alpha/beta hydrolase [Burkholderia stagnalis]|uniref:Alpha/beta hydrolase n=1 Tax=Burkholderia stagnalis TaxID=1503054 RepID=A0A6L3N1G7_9BURK|nr:alpha/beta fold hydrolase [Burkholderia stagnalis]KAB0639940.1 alpha/beta hydrolase [Burkholderia stagnalis]KVO44385.1 alpha/beta hydrolase [Burkholderia stagnalis]KVO81988.1 alpha/beta hydrolase [Burkholderia stagnalis]KVW52275.1 alpha/beta hydrolase [Burkholderia stagnalis]KVW85852.1 alpha/beta hydrolase [Burkholderia stagnalis]
MHREIIPGFDGRPLNVFHSGFSPERRNLMLVLPFGVRHAMAARLCEALAPHVNLVTWESRFVLDLQDDAREDDFDVDYHVRDLVQVAAHANARAGHAGATDVIGYCSGAGISLLAAARHPGTVRRLALVSGEFMLKPSVCRPSSFQREVDVLLPAAAASKDMASVLFDKISSGRSAPQSEFHDFISVPFSSAAHLHRYGLNYVAYRQVDFLNEARAVTQPTLVIATRSDRQVTPDSAHIILSHLTDATGVHEFDGDHYELCRAHPDMTHALLQFFRTESARSGVSS